LDEDENGGTHGSRDAERRPDPNVFPFKDGRAMSAELMSKVRQYLVALEQAQTELLELLSVKQAALTQADHQQVQRLSEAEAQILQRFQGLIAQRSRFLDVLRRQGLPADSIAAFVAAAGGSERAELEERLAASRARGARLRHETWVQWVIAHRCYSHYSELMELIAHRGERPPTYSDAFGSRSGGGAILDAAV
jgi:hypothetical protein